MFASFKNIGIFIIYLSTGLILISIAGIQLGLKIKNDKKFGNKVVCFADYCNPWRITNPRIK
jgi:hypothetical protein